MLSAETSDPCLQFLYENGFNNINEVDRAGWSPFCYAAMRGDPVLVQSFLAKKANPNEVTKKTSFGIMAGESVLSFCAWFRHNEAAKLLIDAKAKVYQGIVGPIKLAAHSDNVDAWHGGQQIQHPNKVGCRIGWVKCHYQNWAYHTSIILK